MSDGDGHWPTPRWDAASVANATCTRRESNGTGNSPPLLTRPHRRRRRRLTTIRGGATRRRRGRREGAP
eukprot:9467692-Pyramimonas_sp.AAC.1